MEKDMNLATAFAELNRIFAGKGMDDYNFELAKPFTDYIAGLWDINARQCMLLSCMLTSMGEEMTTGQIASHIGIDNLMSLTLQKDIDGLVGRGDKEPSRCKLGTDPHALIVCHICHKI